MLKLRRDPFAWIEKGLPPAREGPPIPLTAQSFLVKAGRGAVLSWTFAETANSSYVLLVRLTDKEAQKVFEADYRVEGMLEPVRETMKFKGALLFAVSKSGTVGRRILVPRSSQVFEHEFVQDLMAAAQSIKVHNEIAGIQRQLDSLHDTPTEERDLEFARPFVQAMTC